MPSKKTSAVKKESKGPTHLGNSLLFHGVEVSFGFRPSRTRWQLKKPEMVSSGKGVKVLNLEWVKPTLITLIGGLEHEFYFPCHVWDVIPSH